MKVQITLSFILLSNCVDISNRVDVSNMVALIPDFHKYAITVLLFLVDSRVAHFFSWLYDPQYMLYP